MNDCIRDAAVKVVRRLQEAGHSALFAGGCVRDALLGQRPGDYDIATSARPEQVESLFANTVAIGRQFGVVLVRMGSRSFEVATFREEGEYNDGRHPSTIHFSTAEADARRRDFTINAMFEDPVAGKLLDYVGGKADLERGVIRAVGKAADRFAEDKLRLLRAIRFAARLGFELEPETFEAIRDNAAGIKQVSAERVGEELVKILTEGAARRGFELLDESGLLDLLLPELTPMKGCEQESRYHPEGDVFVHTLSCLELLEENCSETLALGLLLHDVAKPRCAKMKEGRQTFYRHAIVGAHMAAEICTRLRRSKATAARVSFLVEQHLRHCSAPDMRASTLKRFLRQPGIEELLELARIDGEASHSDPSHYEFCRNALDQLEDEAIRPKPLLSGHDLIDLGFEPGPDFREILRTLEDAQLEGEVSTREQALELVRNRYADYRTRPGRSEESGIDS